MKLFKEASMMLSDGLVHHEEDPDCAKVIAAASKHGLPLQLSTWNPGSVPQLREAARASGVQAIVVGALPPGKGEEETIAVSRSLARAGVDMLHAHGTGPLEELHSSARAMAATGLPFSVSAPALAEAIATLDADPQARPWHYLLGCVSPSVAQEVLESTFRAAPALAHRIVGVHGDARDMSASEFASEMSEIAQRFGLNVIGGCCGMDAEKFEALAAAVGKTSS